VNRVLVSLPIVLRFRISRAILATALSGQRRLDANLLPRLQVVRMALDVLDDVFIHDLSLKAFERAFHALAINKLHFSQRISPQFLKYYRRFSVTGSVRRSYSPGRED
jgi:hypothetical protein